MQARPDTPHGYVCRYYQEKAGTNVGAVLTVQVGSEVWDRTADLGGFTARSDDRCIFPMQLPLQSTGPTLLSTLHNAGEILLNHVNGVCT